MRLNEIVEIAKNTELKQIVVGEDDQYILSILNLALIDVYARFDILQEEQLIKIVDEGITRYRLQDNSQKVLQVYGRGPGFTDVEDSDIWQELPINDINQPESVFTPQPYVLHIPRAIEDREYSIIQVVTPPYVTKQNIDTLDLIVPPQLLEPIINYMAYRAYKSMNGSEQTEITAHLNAYERSVNNVYRRGLTHYSMLTNIKLDERGFNAY